MKCLGGTATMGRNMCKKKENMYRTEVKKLARLRNPNVLFGLRKEGN
jgi:hypothetical protein